jgi:hypothetical protein
MRELDHPLTARWHDGADDPLAVKQDRRARGGLPAWIKDVPWVLGRVLMDHWLFVLALLAGVALRVVVSLTYWPALEFYGDSYGYLKIASHLVPGSLDPSGYPIFLALLAHTGNFGAVAITQHVMGVVMAVILYLLLLRLGVRPWLAAIGTMPLLLDGYQLDIEQFVLADVLTEFLVVVALVLLLWPRRRTSITMAAAAGLLMAAATLTRFVGIGVLVLAALYLVARRRWRGLLAYLVPAAMVLVSYGGWYASLNGSFGFSGSQGYALYGRVASFATCDYHLSREEARLCPRQPVDQRTQNVDFYVWLPGSPINQPGLGTGAQRNQLGTQFAEQVILHQPLDYANTVLAGTWHYFTPGRWMPARGEQVELQRWRFPPANLDGSKDALHIYFANYGFGQKPVKAVLRPSLMGPLRSYQALSDNDGPLLLATLVVGLLAGIGLVSRAVRRRDARWAALVMALAGVTLIVEPVMTLGFSYRYGLPLLALLPPAAVIGIDLALDALGRARAGRRSLAMHPGSSPASAADGPSSTAATTDPALA